jgi:hypothetical protein
MKASPPPGVRLAVLKAGLGAAGREVLHRADASAGRIEVVAEAQAAAREPRLRANAAVGGDDEAHGHGHNGRSGGRVAAEEEPALARRGERAEAARTQFAHKGLEAQCVHRRVVSSGGSGHGHHHRKARLGGFGLDFAAFGRLSKHYSHVRPCRDMVDC